MRAVLPAGGLRVEGTVPAEPGTWASAASDRVARRLPATRQWLPHRRAFWVTLRTSYAPRPLAPGFRTIEIEVKKGRRRRVAYADGRGPTLLILPGLYATLDEGLFSEVAELAHRAGRRAALLEDRLAGPTLARNRCEVPDLRQMGDEVGAVASALGEQPDGLAFSAGVAAALAAPCGTFRRLVGWSGVVDPQSVARRVLGHPLLRWYYERVHRRAFAAGGRPAPPLSRTLLAFDAGLPVLRTTEGILLLHADDDPVAPAEAIRSLLPCPGLTVGLLPLGGHLGFGSLMGTETYLEPFALEEGR